MERYNKIILFILTLDYLRLFCNLMLNMLYSRHPDDAMETVSIFNCQMKAQVIPEKVYEVDEYQRDVPYTTYNK